MMTCNYIKADGAKCKATPMRGAEYCYYHNPAIPEQEKQRVRRQGGRNNALAVECALPAIEVNQPADVATLLVDTINRVRDGSLDARIGNSLGVLCGHLLKAYELANLDDRVALFERVILKKG